MKTYLFHLFIIFFLISCKKDNQTNRITPDNQNIPTKKADAQPPITMSAHAMADGQVSFSWTIHTTYFSPCMLTLSTPGGLGSPSGIMFPFAAHSYSLIGTPGGTYSLHIACDQGAGKKFSTFATATVPTTAIPDLTKCPSHSGTMYFYNYLRKVGINGTDLHRSNGQIFIEIPPDPWTDKSYIVRYRKKNSNSNWQLTDAYSGQGIDVFNERRLYIIINNLEDGTEYELQLGIFCGGTGTSFSSSQFNSTYDL
ncbi:MAG: hypothetical protein LBF27_23430 [Sphingobacterium sp.]|jgi:hypothetical protein|nr:hypothetical protein [Sphingobacterium sp.]